MERRTFLALAAPFLLLQVTDWWPKRRPITEPVATPRVVSATAVYDGVDLVWEES